MSTFIPFSQRRGCVLASRIVALALILVTAFASQASFADPGDFAAMPGLWKIVTTPVDHGHAGKSTIVWFCLDEGADPWVFFANIAVPAFAPCQRSAQHRGSTALAWTATCGGTSPSTGRGRVDFDSAEHYTASITLRDRGEVARVEGRRYAACTTPSD
jgi:hypothetical protein